MAGPIKFQLTGWKAVAVIVLFLGFIVFQHFRVQNQLEAEGEAIVKEYLGRKHLHQLNQVIEKYQQSKDVKKTEKEIEKVIEQSKAMEIQSMSARGNGKRFVVRVEYTIQGKPPEDGKSPRYLVLIRSLGTFRVDHETTASSYYLTF